MNIVLLMMVFWSFGTTIRHWHVCFDVGFNNLLDI